MADLIRLTHKHRTRKPHFLAAPVLTAAPWDLVPRNSMVGAMGDSLTCSMTSTLWQNYYASILVAAYQFYALVLPKTADSQSAGLFKVGPMVGTNGANLDTLQNTQLPQILAASPRPGFCLVLGGTNNLAGMVSQAAIDAYVAQLVTIYASLIAAKILPLALGIPTCANPTNRARVPTFNAGIQAAAAALGIPYLDTYPLTDNGVDGWIAGYSSDSNVHWGPVGARVVGQAVRDNLLQPFASLFSAPNLVTAANDTGGGIIFENGSNVDDGDSNNIPDGGETQVANYWTVVTGGADCTFSLNSDGAAGNTWEINKTLNTAETYLLGSSADAQCPTVAPGDLVEIGCNMQVASPEAAATIQFQIYNRGDGTPLVWFKLNNLQAALARFKICRRFYVPAGVTELRMMVKITGGTADLSIGQITIRKL